MHFQKSCTAGTFAKPSMGGSTRCTSVVCKFPEDGATLKAHLRKLGPTVWLVQQQTIKKTNDHGDINKHAKHDAIIPCLLQDLCQLSETIPCFSVWWSYFFSHEGWLFFAKRSVCCQGSHEFHHSFSMQKCQLPNAENFPGRLETMEPVAETMKKHKKKYTSENEWMSPEKGIHISSNHGFSWDIR